MLTVSAVEALLLSSVTTRENTNVTALSLSPSVGAVNVGLSAVALDRIIVVPEVCVHAYVNVSPASVSVEPEPSNVTVPAEATAV